MEQMHLNGTLILLYLLELWHIGQQLERIENTQRKGGTDSHSVVQRLFQEKWPREKEENFDKQACSCRPLDFRNKINIFLIHSIIHQIPQTHSLTPSPLAMLALVCVDKPWTIYTVSQEDTGKRLIVLYVYIIFLVLGVSYSVPFPDRVTFSIPTKAFGHVLNKIISSITSFLMLQTFPGYFTHSQSLNFISTLITVRLVCLAQTSFPLLSLKNQLLCQHVYLKISQLLTFISNQNGSPHLCPLLDTSYVTKL